MIPPSIKSPPPRDRPFRHLLVTIPLLFICLNLNCKNFLLNSTETELEHEDFEEPDSLEIPWPELAFDKVKLLPNPGQFGKKPPIITTSLASLGRKFPQPLDTLLVTPVYPAYVHSLDMIKPFFGGFIGLRGNSKVYVVENHFKPYLFQDLYPHVIQVLSREYGCFIKKKISWIDKHQFVCRDRRNIFAWYHPGLGWTRMIFRQFDQLGYEIKVKHKIVMRISDRRVLDRTLKPELDAH